MTILFTSMCKKKMAILDQSFLYYIEKKTPQKTKKSLPTVTGLEPAILRSEV